MNTKDNSPIFSRVLGSLEGGGDKISVTGLWGSSKALFLWELAKGQRRPVLVLSPTQKEAQAIASDYAFFASRDESPKRCAYFPAYDVLPYDVIEPDPAIIAERLKTLSGVSEGQISLVAAPIKAYMQRLPAPDSLVGEGARVSVRRGEEIGHDKFVKRLSVFGYSRVPMVYEPGEFSVRGGILDVFPPGMDMPVRMEFFGDTVESIRAFDMESQRSVSELDEFTVSSASESGAKMAELAAYFKEGCLLVLDEPDRLFDEAKAFYARAVSSYVDYTESKGKSGTPAPEELYVTPEEIRGMSGRMSVITLEHMPLSAPAVDWERYEYPVRSAEGLRLREDVPASWPEDLPKTPTAIFCRNIKDMAGDRVVNVVSHTQGQAERIREIFAEHGLPAGGGRYILPGEDLEKGVARVAVGVLEAGFVMDEPGLAFVTAKELFGEKPKGAPAPRAKVERFLTSLSELSTGGLVVHVDHGVGRFEGIRRLKLLGVETDFLDVVYQEGARLYVPVDELGKLQKYLGGEDSTVKLDRLGGVSWERTKQRAKKAVMDMAGELLELYAARAVTPGFACSPDDHLYREMESAFEYEETPDQARAIMDVKEDLERPHPMDRLICGDVGYGKTEVALRAAFKEALDGRQTAILTPTTLLASQHYDTFTARLAAFPVKVEMLSRFTPKERVKEIKAGIKAGSVDIVIGTHRLLQKDVAFNTLGLVVVDEEHRFGVAHKEKLKKMRKEVDVLTLTATPIPRTLNMSITGIRDLSIIETPPPDRLPIKTIVTRFDHTVIKEAVQREMMRGGQVFFVHNRIESIFKMAATLSAILPEARIGVAHGRMREDALESVMREFIEGRLDMLLTTAIIESGLDIPRANTIIINRADRFGLADLYQLRGRVGRSRSRAYAYLLVPDEGAITEGAQKRLRVLSELTELGAGFRLALHDLEIRGAGNVLGAEQSGHIAAVGFELYTQMLEDAVRELKGEVVEEAFEPAMDLKVSAFIPEDYVPDAAHRLGIYKRIAGAASGAEVEELRAEIADRYGPIPGPAMRLTEVMEIKALARQAKVAGVQVLPSETKLTFTNRVAITPERLIKFLEGRRGKARYVPDYNIFVKTPPGGWDERYLELKNCLKELT